MNREYPKNPIMGVGGIVFRDDMVLLAKRGNNPGKGDWSIPGGAVELGENLIGALKREIFEEVSIGIEVAGFVRLFDRIIKDHKGKIKFHYIIADYWCWFRSGNPIPGSDVSDVMFVPYKKLRDMNIDNFLIETIEMAIDMKERIDIA